MTDTRKFIPHMEPIPVSTDFGTLYAVATSANHVVFSTSGSYSQGVTTIAVNGVALTCHIHMYRDLTHPITACDWTHFTPAENDTIYRRSSVSAWRVENYQNASPAAHKKIAASLVPTLAAWCEGNQAILDTAERGRLSNEVMSASKKLHAARDAYHAAQDEYAAAVDAEGVFTAAMTR